MANAEWRVANLKPSITKSYYTVGTKEFAEMGFSLFARQDRGNPDALIGIVQPDPFECRMANVEC